MTRTDIPAEPFRIRSVDVFRGLTMLVMIFVNDVGGVKGLPWWTYHMPPGKDGMTYVDMVYPAFLFIVGMAVPLAIERRLAKGESMARLWLHIATRSLTLIVLGIFLANSHKMSAALTGITGRQWTVLGLLGAILFWNVYPAGGRQRLHKALRIAGLVMLVTMFALFRRKAPDGSAAWLDFSYWEILGLIGRAYLAACLLYVPLRKWRWAPFVLLGALVGLNVASRLGWTPMLRHMPFWFWPFGRGDSASIIMAGIALSAIMLEKRIAIVLRSKIAWALGYAALLFAVGWLARPLGLTKLGATPSWCLWCSATSVLLFLALYWVCDVRRLTGWAAVVQPAGSNTLLTYLLPYLTHGMVGSLHLGTLTRSGWPGAVKAAMFTLMILGLSGLLTRLKVRMQI